MPNTVLDSQSRDIVLSLTNYFTAEYNNGGPLLPFASIIQRVATALNISSRTVQRIKNCVKRNESLDTPGKSRHRKSPKTVDLDDKIKSEIRNVIYNMYLEKKPVTLQSLSEELATKQVVSAHLTTIRKLLLNIGFKHEKDDNRNTFMERSNITLSRIDFFRKYMKNKHSEYPRQLVFVDETWIDRSKKSMHKPAGCEGNRLIALHAGTEKGLVRDTALIYATTSSNQGDMTPDIFLKWLEEKLIPNLEEPSIIIMDNASCHGTLMEKQPTGSWTKDQIEEWLKENKVSFNDDLFKLELLNLAEQHKKPTRYKAEKILQDNGHEVLRLPPYHSQFNAIELVWAEAKDYYNKHIGKDGSRDDKVIAMWERALQECTLESWKLKVLQTKNVIEQWYHRERIIDDVPELIIHVGDDSDDDSDMDEL